MSATRRVFLRMAGASAIAAASACGGRGAGGGSSRNRFAMAIDTARCAQEKGCRACIDACHAAHNVPDVAAGGGADPRQEVKWLWKERARKVFPDVDPVTVPAGWRDRDVLVLCNHCDNPPCVRVCPAGATWRRDDGIVTIDQHRCIGCRYCLAACPYGSRSFNWTDPRPHLARVNPDYPTRTKGVVEKCNLCEERLAQGRPPACASACPAKAMVFGDLNDAGGELRRFLAARFSIRRRPELGTRPQVYYLP